MPLATIRDRRQHEEQDADGVTKLAFAKAALVFYDDAVFEAQTATLEPGFENTLHLLCASNQGVDLFELFRRKRVPAGGRRCLVRKAVEQCAEDTSAETATQA